jgi:hypothetical protein
MNENVYAEVALKRAHNPKVNYNIRFLKMVKVNLMLDDKGG